MKNRLLFLRLGACMNLSKYTPLQLDDRSLNTPLMKADTNCNRKIDMVRKFLHT